MEVIKVSIAFMPCEKVNAVVRGLKDRLQSLVGWYSSCNAAGHVTICEFMANRDELDDIVAKLRTLLVYEHAQHVYFNTYATFSNGMTYTYYMAPTVQSKIYFQQRAAVVTAGLKNRYSLGKVSNAPHLTIGRKLEIDKLNAAKDLLKHIDLDFFCDSVFLRVFNPIRRQYDVYASVPFGGREKLIEEGQLRLNF